MSRIHPCDQCGAPSVVLLYRCYLCAKCRDEAVATSDRWKQEKRDREARIRALDIQTAGVPF
jgi:peroxiredoxin